eukprot:1307186-Rhodomonas_salina.2
MPPPAQLVKSSDQYGVCFCVATGAAGWTPCRRSTTKTTDAKSCSPIWRWHVVWDLTHTTNTSPPLSALRRAQLQRSSSQNHPLRLGGKRTVRDTNPKMQLCASGAVPQLAGSTPGTTVVWLVYRRSSPTNCVGPQLRNTVTESCFPKALAPVPGYTVYNGP